VAAGKDVAVVFDEEDIPGLFSRTHGRQIYAAGGAASGARSLRMHGGQRTMTPFLPLFGHSLADFDFEIAEIPEPGQYRWLEFQVRREEEADDVAARVRLTDGAQWELSVDLGSLAHLQEAERGVNVLHGIPSEWTRVRVDLWQAAQELGRSPTAGESTFRIRNLNLEAFGGTVFFDRIVLGRSPEALEADAVVQ
jgi:hypothetical protein